MLRSIDAAEPDELVAQREAASSRMLVVTSSSLVLEGVAGRGEERLLERLRVRSGP